MYAIGHYADFYHLRHVLVTGRVTSGSGGERLLLRAARGAGRGVPGRGVPHPRAHAGRKGQAARPGHRRRQPPVDRRNCGLAPGSLRFQTGPVKFSHPQADIFVPDPALATADALVSLTHLCEGANQDDIEIMAQAGISDCLDAPGTAYGGVVVTNGAGSPRTGAYAAYTDEQMLAVRREEQREAARLGRYSIQLQLAHPSADVKRPGHPGVAADLLSIFSGCRPAVVYLHYPADKHDTHVAVLLRCLEAIRALPAERRPARVLGCEVWRDLDWVPDTVKVALDAGRNPELARLLAVFDSQISGGKRV